MEKINEDIKVGDVLTVRATGRVGHLIGKHLIKWLDDDSVEMDWGAVEGKTPKINRLNFRIANEEEINNLLQSLKK